ncbi:MAG TPA: hypothetical protein VJR04_03790 [Terriglobales bacterium]|nr:hypothetical protein [Terriglobales bacterium]
MSISGFFGNEAIHLDFQQQCSLECGDDLSAHTVIDKIFEQRGRFKISILRWFRCVLLLLTKPILLEEHELLFSGPAQRVPVQTAGQREGKLTAEQSWGCRCGQFEEQQKSLLCNILSREFLKPSADFAIGSMNGRHEGEHQDRLAHLGIAGVSPRLDDCAEHFTWRWRAVLAAFLRVEVADERAGIRKRRKHRRNSSDLTKAVRAGELFDGGKKVALHPANMAMAIQVLSHECVSLEMLIRFESKLGKTNPVKSAALA